MPLVEPPGGKSKLAAFVAQAYINARRTGRYRSGQTGRTVNPLAYAFVGSNPTLPTLLLWSQVGGRITLHLQTSMADRIAPVTLAVSATEHAHPEGIHFT